MEEAMKIFCLLFITALLSCTNKNNQQIVEVPNVDKIKNETQSVNNINNTTSDIISNFDTARNKVRDIVLLKNTNFGIKGGDNWLTVWKNYDNKDSIIIIYVISNNKIIKSYNPNIRFHGDEYKVFDIMQDIPGQRILDRYASIGDYNNDGYDELIYIIEDSINRENIFEINGYDPTEDTIVEFCKLNFKYIDIDNGPSPIKFIQYKGKEGFQIYLEDHYDRDTAYWGFVSWSAITGQYEIEEYEPE
jgi:hypothetical protein